MEQQNNSTGTQETFRNFTENKKGEPCGSPLLLERRDYCLIKR
jgi:hypothetical protein